MEQEEERGRNVWREKVIYTNTDRTILISKTPTIFILRFWGWKGGVFSFIFTFYNLKT